VDDGVMGITQVLRGADLLSSTARQILLHRLLGQPEPRWAHAPLVLAGSGERLAKRGKALSLAQLRRRGVDPRRIVAHLARLSGLQAPEACQPAHVIAGRAPGGSPRAPVRLASVPYGFRQARGRPCAAILPRSPARSTPPDPA